MAATDLTKVVDDELDVSESVYYQGFHIMAQGNGLFHVQLDGHAGSICNLDAADYDNTLQLVDDLNYYVNIQEEYIHLEDDEALVEWAGRVMTSDPKKADENPNKYLYVPPADKFAERKNDTDGETDIEEVGYD